MAVKKQGNENKILKNKEIDKIQKAKEQLLVAYKNIIEVLDENCYDEDNLSDGYVESLHIVAIDIMKLRCRF